MEKRIRLKEHSVNVKWIAKGDPASVVLVFLHEALGSIPQWKAFPDELCTILGLPGVVIERQGHGQSDALTAKRTETYLHDYTYELKAALEEILPLSTSVMLVGHSDGGTIALLYAKWFPKNVEGIVTMAAHTFVEPQTLAGIEPAVRAFEEGKLAPLYRIHGEKTKELFYAWADTWSAPFFLSWDIREAIKGLEMPVLAMQGNEDQYGTEKQLQSIKEAGEQTETILLKGCKHHPHIEKKDEVLQLIKDWYLKQRR